MNRILITGGAVRIGKAIAESLAQTGAEILIHYNRSEKEARETAESIRSNGGTAILFQKDLNSEEAVLELFEELKLADAIPNILINSASIFESDRFEESSKESLERNMTINSFVPHWLTRELAKRNSSGQIINILDTKITCYDETHFSYHLSKRNLFTLTKLSALELAPNFRVNGIALGAILPPVGLDQNYLQSRADETPLKLAGSVESVIDTIKFLLNAPLITGQIIYLDGGFHLKGALYA